MGYNRAAPKRPVNMTLNEDLVRRVRGLSTNLSETVHSLLADFVEELEAKAVEPERQIAAAVAANEAFVPKYGSLTDDFSELGGRTTGKVIATPGYSSASSR